MNRLIGLSAIFLTIFSLSFTAQAENFRNAYVSFQKPPNWDCRQEGTEWVCTNKFAKKAKEAIIILTAKEVGPTDSLPAYEAHLKTPRTLAPKAGKPGSRSKVTKVGRQTINGTVWIDGLHKGSEVSGYYTRYLATIKNRLAILVTFSAHKTHYTKYSADFIKTVKSLRVVADKNILSSKPRVDIRPSTAGTIGAPIGGHMPMDVEPPPPPKSGGLGKMVLLLGLLLVAAAIFMLRKKK